MVALTRRRADRFGGGGGQIAFGQTHFIQRLELFVGRDPSDLLGHVLAGVGVVGVVRGDRGDAGGPFAVEHRVGGDELGMTVDGIFQGGGDRPIGERRSGQRPDE